MDPEKSMLVASWQIISNDKQAGAVIGQKELSQTNEITRGVDRLGEIDLISGILCHVNIAIASVMTNCRN